MKRLFPLLLLCSCQKKTGNFYEDDGIWQNDLVTSTELISPIRELELEIRNGCSENILLNHTPHVELLLDGHWQEVEFSKGQPYGEPAFIPYYRYEADSTSQRTIVFENLRTTYYQSYKPLTSGSYRIWLDFKIADDYFLSDSAPGAAVVAYFTVAPPTMP